MNSRFEEFPLGRRVTVPGHFAAPVVLEAVRRLGEGYECRVRMPDGTPDEAVLSPAEAELVFDKSLAAPATIRPADPERLRLLVESARIRLAYAHDRHFAVSLSGIRTLPHQIEAVYIRMLPQPRLRFLLADDPGAGKTIMAGLLHKEMKLRKGIERVLILWEAERVGHLKIGFDVRSLGPADLQTGYRDPVEGIRRIEVKGRSRGYAIRLTTNEWYNATQLGDSYWLPLGDNPELVTIRNPAAKLDHAKKEVIAARCYDVPADALKEHGQPVV